jgi:predicted N-acetyltransferase YhbS
MVPLPSITIATENDADRAIAHEIDHRLIEALRQNVPPNDAQQLTLVARRGGDLIGGLVGSTSYGWLLVKMLWVAEPERGHGLGTRLMAQAEAVARSRGCHGAWLDTSSARAEQLYARLGYAPFGTLQNEPGEHPQGHRRAFLAKRLTAGAG